MKDQCDQRDPGERGGDPSRELGDAPHRSARARREPEKKRRSLFEVDSFLLSDGAKPGKERMNT